MPRKKETKEGFHTLHIPEGYYEMIREYVEADDSYYDKTTWTIKYLFVIHGMVDR